MAADLERYHCAAQGHVCYQAHRAEATCWTATKRTLPGLEMGLADPVSTRIEWVGGWWWGKGGGKRWVLATVVVVVVMIVGEVGAVEAGASGCGDIGGWVGGDGCWRWG